MDDQLILSIFPGIDLLGQGFEALGFCVVRGPDLMTGGDIRAFNPPRNRFHAVIGGPPCQDFSALNRHRGDYGQDMLNEYCRVVALAAPDWFLFENVANAPAFAIAGYETQRFDLNLAWFSDFSRLRHFVFGSKNGRLLDPMKGKVGQVAGTAVTGKDSRSFAACCEIQGLPANFDLPFFSLGGKKQAVANGVPLAMSHYIARLIVRDYYREVPPENTSTPAEVRRCQCGCGRVVVGRALHRSVACRKRAQRTREKM